MTSIFKFYVQKWLQSHVPHVRKIIFDSGDRSWLFVTWPWPWSVLSVSLILIFTIFTSPLRLLWSSFEQKLSILLTQGFVIRKRQNLNFDLTLTRDLRSINNFKYYAEKSRGELSSAVSPGLIRPLVPEIAGGGRSGPPPPPQTVVGTEIAQTVPG